MYRLILIFLLSFPISAAAQSYSELSFGIGAGASSKTQKGTDVYFFSVKGVKQTLVKGMYLSYGLGVDYYKIRYKEMYISTPFYTPNESAFNISAPLGIGYMGGKNLAFSIGADMLPSYSPLGEFKRVAIGAAPNFTLTFKIGPKSRLGIIGKAVFLSSSDNTLNANYIGGGLVMQGL